MQSPARTLLAGFALTALLGAAELAGQEGADTAGEVFELEEFQVTGSEFDAFKAAIANQREAGNIKTVVDAGAFGDVTEGNVGEFLKYLPGVSVDFVAADIRSVSVRGLAPNFTPVMMDGNRMASAASSESSRTFEFEQVSLNNVARIEVVKSPTPAMEADSLGGSVNMISRNAFEISERRLDYRFYFNVPENYIEFEKTPGPGRESTYKVRPGFDFTYYDAFTENFGIVLNYMNSETFTPQEYFITQWDVLASEGQQNPFLRYFNLRDGPKISSRESIGLKLDWRITPSSILSLGFQHNEYSTSFFNREVRWEISNASVTAESYGPTYTTRDPSKDISGRFRHQVNTREKTGQTDHIDLGMKHFWDKWELTYGGYYSKSTNEYKDTDNGVFERVVFRTVTATLPLDVAYLDIGENGPAAVPTPVNGVAYDPFPFTDITPLEYVRSAPEQSSDEIYGGKFDLKQNFDLGGNPASWQTGMLYRIQERNIDRQQYQYDPNGFYTVNTPGSAAFKDEHYINMPLGFGWRAPEWPDARKLYEYYLEHPDQFTLREVDSVIYNAENLQRVEETVTAGYLMGTVALMDNRLKLITGVRYEKTDTVGEGFLYDSTVIYERNADGSFVKKFPFLPDNPLNRVLKPEFEGTGTAAVTKRVKAQYAGRRTVSNRYDDFYPSIHLTYLVTNALQARFSYARTLGRPDIDDLAPGIRYNSVASHDEEGIDRYTVIVSNPNLEAYTSDNFDLSLEYYFASGGVVSAGLFHKKIKGFIDTQTTLLTYELAEALDIDPVYVDLGWQVETTVNAGDVTIKGYEVSLIQELKPIWSALDGFSIFANATALSTEGDYGDMQDQLVSSYIPGFVKQTANWGITYDKGRWDIRLKWNHRGKQMRDSGDVRGFYSGDGTIWNRFYDERLTTDLNLEFRVNQYLRLFLNGRNIFDEPTDQLRVGTDTPNYAALERRENFGALWSIGIKGTY